ncbi:SCO4848 family membrane protein [Nocardioides sp.]|uniref:SCO4848 family membrane protein n=1 Tax=Nocardioides sp. TaxID=35761 RepID=UPI00356528FC
MRFERKHGWLLVGVAIWNVVIWSTFAKNLAAAHSSGQERATGYWVAHTMLIVVDLVIAGVLGALGLKALRRTTSA